MRHRVAQAGTKRRPDYESGGQEFESLRARHFHLLDGPEQFEFNRMSLSLLTRRGGPDRPLSAFKHPDAGVAGIARASLAVSGFLVCSADSLVADHRVVFGGIIQS